MPRKHEIEGVGDKFPSFFSFGPKPRFLSPEETVAAGAEERIASIWPYIVRRVIEFARKLKQREIANFNQEDMTQELWIVLREKDHRFNPSRGVYMGFARSVIDRHFCTIREKSHTVESPRNTGCRITQFAAEVQEGPLTSKKSKTFNDIQRSILDLGPVGDQEGGPSPGVQAEVSDEHAINAHSLSLAIRDLSPIEARVIGRTFGLYGQPTLTANDMADEWGYELAAIKRIRSRAQEKIRQRLLDMGHPAVASDN